MFTKAEKGFSLIELIIVVAIIGLLASIAIPNLLTSRLKANEASAISTLRLISNAEVTYRLSNGSFGNITTLNSVGLLDNRIPQAVSGGTPYNGYFYSIIPFFSVPLNEPRFDATAVPAVYGGQVSTGSKSFYIGEPGIIYYTPGATPPIADSVTRIVTNGSPIDY
jgi:prepilin-type N-terminal cleavage/methylation domain-containing protein